MKKFLFIILSILFLAIPLSQAMDNVVPMNLNLKEIGQKIYMNECSSKLDRIISWNKGEQFLSLGIGHFIWFPKDYDGPYQETFPDFIKLVKQKRPKAIPQWLAELDPMICPWNNREEFQISKDAEQVNELRQFLLDTMDLQAELMSKRALSALPVMIENANFIERWSIRKKFYALTSSPNGMFAIIDYINFKGEGPSKENYKGQGWGLLQVLEEMKDIEAGPGAINIPNF